MTLADLKKLLKTDKLIIGKERTIKSLKLGKLEQVFLSSNCSCIEDIEYYAGLSGKAKVDKLKVPNDELGVICKKPFSISVIGVLKG